MKGLSRMALLALAGWGLPVAAAAQTAPQTAAPSPLRVVTPVERDKIAVEQMAAQGGGRGGVVASVETRITTGKPYSAEAVTESLQVLGDGNRIAKRNVTRVYRDNDGRTRREHVQPDGTLQTITINDPVAHVSYTLNPQTRTGYQATMLALRTPSQPAVVPPSGYARGSGGTVTGGDTGGARGRATATASVSETPAERDERLRKIEQARAARVEQAETSQAAAGQAKRVIELAASGGAQTKKEDLGEQMIEGVRATGTRSTTVIPAGSSVGNLNEIRIVSEQWFSPDLDVLVLTKHSDPRVGETTYRLTNIIRAQPDPNLFVAPADYTIRGRNVRNP